MVDVQPRRLLAVLSTYDGKAGDIHYESTSGRLSSDWSPCLGAAGYDNIPRNRGTERQLNDISAKASIELLAGGVTSHQDPQVLRKAQRPWQGLQ